MEKLPITFLFLLHPWLQKFGYPTPNIPPSSPLEGLLRSAFRDLQTLLASHKLATGINSCSSEDAFGGRTVGGFDRCHDNAILSAISQGKFTISGLRNIDLQRLIPNRKSGWISRCLKRLRVHGLIKRVGRTYKYYLTELGRRTVLTGLKLREMVVIPALAQPDTGDQV